MSEDRFAITERFLQYRRAQRDAELQKRKAIEDQQNLLNQHPWLRQVIGVCKGTSAPKRVEEKKEEEPEMIVKKKRVRKAKRKIQEGFSQSKNGGPLALGAKMQIDQSNMSLEQAEGHGQILANKSKKELEELLKQYKA